MLLLCYAIHTLLQVTPLNKLTDAVKEYLKTIEIPKGGRHRKTTFVFVGDRFKPDSIDCHIVKLKKNGDGEFIKQDATD